MAQPDMTREKSMSVHTDRFFISCLPSKKERPHALLTNIYALVAVIKLAYFGIIFCR